ITTTTRPTRISNHSNRPPNQPEPHPFEGAEQRLGTPVAHEPGPLALAGTLSSAPGEATNLCGPFERRCTTVEASLWASHVTPKGKAIRNGGRSGDSEVHYVVSSGHQDANPGCPGARPSRNARSPSCPSSLVRRSAIRRAVS